MSSRKSAMISTGVNNHLKDLKKELKLKNDSEVIGYLIAIRNIFKEKITLSQHNEAIKEVEQIHNQETL